MQITKYTRNKFKETTEILHKLSDNGELCTETYNFARGKVKINTIRGGAIEKASIMFIFIKNIQIPGFDKSFDRNVFQMEIFPANPHCPMGHFNTGWTLGTSMNCSMNIDLFPAVLHSDDIDNAKDKMDAIAIKFKKDPSEVHIGLSAKYKMDHWDAPLASSSGFCLTGLGESDIDFFSESINSFFDVYLSIVERHKDDNFSEDEELLKLNRNARWLEYITLKDRAVKMALDVGFPKEVIVKFAFPPSCVF